MKCHICGNNKLTKILDLGCQPPSDAFLTKADLKKPENSYPLELYFCKRCSLVQLGCTVDPEILFRDYVYTSGMNNSLKMNFKNLVSKIVKKFKLTKSDLAVDIGCNDGTLLGNYQHYGIKTLGIDPSNATKFAIEKGITTMVDFFNKNSAIRARKKYGQAKIITATNVFAHVPDLNSFMQGIANLLTSDGVFITESGYLLDLIEKTQYDSVYHEHLRYYSLLSLTALFKQFGLEIFDVERINTHNGSIRVYASKADQYPKSVSMSKLLKLEKQCRLNSLKTMQQFATKATRHRLILQNLLSKLKKNGKTIAGIGAPAKGNTLLNFCHLDQKTIEYLTEKSDLKIGLYAPGTHIPVVAEKIFYTRQPDYGLILSWNIAKELINKIKKNGFKGKFIIPFPKPIII